MIEFRQIRPEDFPALERLSPALKAAIGDSPRSDWQPAGPRTGWVGCSQAGELIAAALACRRGGELLGIAVHPDFRGKGIGRELLRQAEAWLFSHGGHSVFATSEDIPAEFLRHHGWEVDSREPGRFRKESEGPAIPLEEHWVEDPATGYGRLVRLMRGPSDRLHSLCLVLDGETYWRDLAAIPVFQEIAAASPFGMTFAFVGHVSALARHEDFTANERYARFIGEAVVPWLQEEVPSLATAGHTIVGLSLSGLMAVHVAMRYPVIFEACVSQSGSHWWDHSDFESTAESHSPLKARFWLSVGKNETATDLRHPPSGLHQTISQVDGVKHAAKALRQFGGTVRHQEFEGGHSWQCWRGELREAIEWSMQR